MAREPTASRKKIELKKVFRLDLAIAATSVASVKVIDP